MYTVTVTLRRLLVRQPVVVFPGRLMRKMLERVPLRARLSIYIYFVVHGLEVQPRHEVYLLLVELLAAEPRELDIVKRPIELDMFARVYLARCCLDDGWGEEVESFVMK